MINNSTNINKTNNHLSHSIWTEKTPITYDVGHSEPDLGQAQHCGGAKPLNDIEIRNECLVMWHSLDTLPTMVHGQAFRIITVKLDHRDLIFKLNKYIYLFLIALLRQEYWCISTEKFRKCYRGVDCWKYSTKHTRRIPLVD